MSASKEKKQRKALKQSPDYKPPKQKQRMSGAAVRIIQIAVILVVVLVISLGILTSGMLYPYIAAVDVDGENISVAEYNYYLNTSANNYANMIYQMYGSEMSAYMPDLTKSLKSQQYSEDMTWADFLEEQTLTGIKRVVALSKKAETAGLALDAEDTQTIDTTLKSVTDYAAERNTNVVRLLSADYGKGVDLKILRKVFERELLANKYSTKHAEETDLGADVMGAYYKAHTDEVDEVSYRLFSFKTTADAPEEGEAELTEEEKTEANAAALEDARKKAAELAAKITSPDDFNTFAKEYASADAAESYDDPSTGYMRGSIKANLDETIANWLFDPVRKDNETGVLEIKDTNDATSSIVVIMRLTRGRGEYNMVNVRHLLITPKKDADAEEATDAQWEEARVTAQSRLDEYLSGEKTEDAFAALATKYTEDTASKENGGLYEDIPQGYMVSPFDSWIYESQRKEGDTGLVKTSYGYHVIYFAGTSDIRWESIVREKLKTIASDALQSEIDTEFSYATHPFWLSFSGTK